MAGKRFTDEGRRLADHSDDVELDADSVETAVSRIVVVTDRIARQWSAVAGWAPEPAAGTLGRARLDRHASLARTLSLWVNDTDDGAPDRDGRLILAWANLGALLEGALRWFAAVYADHYFADDAAPRAPKSTDPDELDEVTFERLRIFFAKRVWVPTDRYDVWIQVVQQRRNTIHAFRSRPLGSFAEFRAHVVLFADMLDELERRVPDRPPGEC